MTIGVLIPIFNGESTIRKTLDSILNQSELPYEICLVDDGSTDNSESIIRSYAHDAKSVLWKIIQTENQGLGAARNEGLSVMTSDYIALLDADDTWSHDKLAHCRTYLEANPETDLLYHPVWEWDANSGMIRKRRDLPLESTKDIWLHNPITPSAAVFKRSSFHWEFMTDPAIHGVEDALLWTEAMNAGLTIRRMPNVDTFYRVNHGMTTNRKEHEEHIRKAVGIAISKGWIEQGVEHMLTFRRAYYNARLLHKAKAFDDAVAQYELAGPGLQNWLLRLLASIRYRI